VKTSTKAAICHIRANLRLTPVSEETRAGLNVDNPQFWKNMVIKSLPIKETGVS